MSYFPGLNNYDDQSKGVSPASSIVSTPASDDKTNGEVRKGRSTRRAAKACKSCHSLKVKCTPADEDNPLGPCLRCLNSKRKCEMDPNQTRKRRKKAEMNDAMDGNSGSTKQDQTIAGLQAQVKFLTEQLASRGQGTADTSPGITTGSELDEELRVVSDCSSAKLTNISTGLKDTADRRCALLENDASFDVIKSGLITMEEARERLEMYKTKMNAVYHLVDIPKEITVEDLQSQLPFLFLAIMSVTNTIYSKPIDLNITLAIDNAAMKGIILEVLVAGSKSVELIKSLLLLCLWYNTPELFRYRRNHLLNTISVTMLHDLGIVGRPFYERDSEDGSSNDKCTNTEYRCLIMVLYFTTVGICLTLRRKIYVKWTPFVEECCVLLERSGIPEQAKIALFLRLSHEMERIYYIVHSPDVSSKGVTFTRYVVQEIQKNLNMIKIQIPKDDHATMGYFYSVEAYLHEPIFSHIIKNDVKDISEIVLDLLSARSITNCTTASLSALDEFRKLSPGEFASLPLGFASRIIYIVGILLKLRYLILSLPSIKDKDLVPQHAITLIQSLLKLIDHSSAMHNVNHILKKTRLVLQLFIQAYATQVQELVKKHGSNPQNSQSNLPGTQKVDLNEIQRLSKIFKKNNTGGLITTNSGDSYPPHIPLDILSYAASCRRNLPKDQLVNEPEQGASNTLQLFQNQQQSGPLPQGDSGALFYRQNSGAAMYPQIYPPYTIPNSDLENQSNIQPDNMDGVTAPTMYNQAEVDADANNVTNDANDADKLNALPAMVNPDQLENLYDEFWTDLINADSDKMDFLNYSNNLAPLNDEIFFMP